MTNGKSAQGSNAQLLINAYGREKVHESRTLDRYYYSSLPDENVQKRNVDQVLTKYITKREGQDKTNGSAPAVSQNTKPTEGDTGLILRVDQLWLWVINDSKHNLSEISNVLELLIILQRQNNY